MRISALQSQQTMRDLSALPELCDDIQWMDEASLAASCDPAVVVGTWLFEAKSEAKKLLAARCEMGAATIVVPRWKSGNFGKVLGAPTDVETEFGEFDNFTIDDRTVELPGQSIIKSTLHIGRWGETKGGTTILAYRPSEGAGAVVLCTAALCSQRFGVEASVQRDLLIDLIQRGTSSHGVTASTVADSGEQIITPPASIEDYLAADPNNAAVTLATIINDGNTETEPISRLLTALGMEIAPEQLSQSLQQLTAMSQPTVDEMETALKQFGWSAYLRLARQRFPRRATSTPETEPNVTQGEAIER